MRRLEGETTSAMKSGAPVHPWLVSLDGSQMTETSGLDICAVIGVEIHGERRGVDLAFPVVTLDVFVNNSADAQDNLLMHSVRRGHVIQLAIDELGTDSLGEVPIIFGGERPRF